jgi:hypothetical protein
VAGGFCLSGGRRAIGPKPKIGKRQAAERAFEHERERSRVLVAEAALLGWVADWKALAFAFLICSFLPAIGILTAFLPNLRERQPRVL